MQHTLKAMHDVSKRGLWVALCNISRAEDGSGGVDFTFAVINTKVSPQVAMQSSCTVRAGDNQDETIAAAIRVAANKLGASV